MVLPDFGATQGEYKVAVIGHNFAPNSKLMVFSVLEVNITNIPKVKFGDYVVRDIEYHCSSVIIATVNLSQGMMFG